MSFSVPGLKQRKFTTEQKSNKRSSESFKIYRQMTHKILQTGLHTIIDKKGRVHVYTEQEYTHLTWWDRVKLKYNLKSI